MELLVRRTSRWATGASQAAADRELASARTEPSPGVKARRLTAVAQSRSDATPGPTTPTRSRSGKDAARTRTTADLPAGPAGLTGIRAMRTDIRPAIAASPGSRLTRTAVSGQI